MLWLILLGLATAPAFARDLHVSAQGPFRNISAAAVEAQAGDVVIVHAGTYRERVSPPRGGVVYQGAPGEDRQVLKGSEIIQQWKRFQGDVWKVTIANEFFGSYNPYRDLIKGDWFTGKGRPHHTGEVYLDGISLWESATLEGVLHPAAGRLTWFTESDESSTYIYANFGAIDPARANVEINVRESCFYPDKPGVDNITVRGFRMAHAATQWAAPTAEQIGLIGTHWSKGWTIEDNIVSDSKCACVSLGKDRATGHNVWNNDPRKDGATHYNEVIVRALNNGWSREKIGSHVVRNNTIYNCEQAGIVGSLGAIFSEISDNHIFDIWKKRQFTGAEMAGIKLHGAIDVAIRGNRIHNAGRGLWMDWMAQGTRISGNLLYDNSTDDLFVEVNHGPFVVDNNLFLSSVSLSDMSEGGAYVHNLFAGRVVWRPEPRRSTPYHRAHSTALAGLNSTLGGDDRFYNNWFTGEGLWVYNHAEYPLETGGNTYFGSVRPYYQEDAPVHAAAIQFTLKEESDGLYLVAMPVEAKPGVPVTALGRTKVSQLPYDVTIDTDYFGRKRTNKISGPFADPFQGKMKISRR